METWALDLGPVLYECLPPIPPSETLIIGSNTLGSCPWRHIQTSMEVGVDNNNNMSASKTLAAGHSSEMGL